MMGSVYQGILRKGFDDYRTHVNPLIAGRAGLAGEPVRVIRAENGALLNADGEVIEDFHGTQAFGHRNGEIADALGEFLKSDAPSWFPSRVNPFAGRLAKTLCERTGYEQVYFGCTGSDSVEAAIKLARAATGRAGLISLGGGYHGCTMGSCSLMQDGPFRKPFGPHLPGASAIPFDDIDALADVLSTGEVAAVIVEPIQGEGGVRRLGRAFVEALCELTQRHGTLLVADEVQTALGRSGHFVFSRQWPRRPDVLLMAKALGGGYMPISAMLTSSTLFHRAYGQQFEAAEAHNSTFSYNAMSCVAALKTLDMLSDELVAHVRDRGERFRRRLEDRLAGSPFFREARGSGYMVGVALRQPDHPWLSFEQFGFDTLTDRPTIAPLVAHRLYRRGFFTFSCGHDWSILRLQPRFDIPWATLERFVDSLGEELEYLDTIS